MLYFPEQTFSISGIFSPRDVPEDGEVPSMLPGSTVDICCLRVDIRHDYEGLHEPEGLGLALARQRTRLRAGFVVQNKTELQEGPWARKPAALSFSGQANHSGGIYGIVLSERKKQASSGPLSADDRKGGEDESRGTHDDVPNGARIRRAARP